MSNYKQVIEYLLQTMADECAEFPIRNSETDYFETRWNTIAILQAARFIAEAIEGSLEKQVLKEQIKTLRDAIKYGRNYYKCRHNMTMRQFAESLGTTAKQLSDWTEAEINTEPDFRD